MKKIYTIALILFTFSIAFSQDTITVMHYNLLGYANSYGNWCNSTNNNIDTKEASLKIILKDIMPDIFTCNEFGDELQYVNRMKNNVLNTDGINYYESSTYQSEDFTSIINMLFYNKNKFSVVSEIYVPHTVSDVRKSKLIKLKYLPNNSTDEIYIVCVLTHLKAKEEDSLDRKTMVNDILNYMLANYDSAGNYLIMGDFNIYSSSESAYKNLINNANTNIKFYDPINTPGDWNNNYSYRNVHTQSTHADDNGCAATGGMDDRFDFILMSNPLNAGSLKATYVANSYKAYGQDGYHYNKSINDGANANPLITTEIANALYTASDHLPVTMKIKLSPTVGIEKVLTTSGLTFIYTNPLSKGSLDLKINNNNHYFGNIKVEICSIIGQTVNSGNYEISNGSNQFSIDLSNVKSGIYLIKITDKFNGTNTQKLIIKN